MHENFKAIDDVVLVHVLIATNKTGSFGVTAEPSGVGACLQTPSERPRPQTI